MPSVGLCPGARRDVKVQAKAGHMVLGVSLLIPPFTPTWAFLDLQEKVIALDVTGRA